MISDILYLTPLSIFFNVLFIMFFVETFLFFVCFFIDFIIFAKMKQEHKQKYYRIYSKYCNACTQDIINWKYNIGKSKTNQYCCSNKNKNYTSSIFAFIDELLNILGGSNYTKHNTYNSKCHHSSTCIHTNPISSANNIIGRSNNISNRHTKSNLTSNRKRAIKGGKK